MSPIKLLNNSQIIHELGTAGMRRSTISSGGFTPASDANLVAWYDPSLGDTVGYTFNSGSTATLIDQSGNSNTLNRAGTGYTITTAAKNGLDVFTTAGSARMEAALASGSYSQPWSIIFIFRYQGTSDDTGELVMSNSAGSLWQLTTDHGDFGTPPNSLLRIVPGSGQLTSSTATDTNWHILCGVYNGANSKLFIDGTTEETYNADTVTDTTKSALVNIRLTLGLSAGNMGEMIFVNGDIDADGTLSDYFTYLNNKWAVV